MTDLLINIVFIASIGGLVYFFKWFLPQPNTPHNELNRYQKIGMWSLWPIFGAIGIWLLFNAGLGGILFWVLFVITKLIFWVGFFWVLGNSFNEIGEGIERDKERRHAEILAAIRTREKS